MKTGFNPRQVLMVIAIVGTLATASAAQGTQGIAGLNDYTVNGLNTGTRSCQFVTTPPSPTTVTFNVNTLPNMPVAFVFNLGCPCQECFTPMVATSCGLPLLGCGLSNHALELWPPCSTIVVVAISDGGGNATLVAPVSSSFFFSTQAAVFGPPCDTGNPVLTQAYNVFVP